MNNLFFPLNALCHLFIPTFFKPPNHIHVCGKICPNEYPSKKGMVRRGEIRSSEQEAKQKGP